MSEEPLTAPDLQPTTMKGFLRDLGEKHRSPFADPLINQAIANGLCVRLLTAHDDLILGMDDGKLTFIDAHETHRKVVWEIVKHAGE